MQSSKQYALPVITTMALWQLMHLGHGRRVNFERGCRINGQKGTNLEHSFQNNNIQKIFQSVIIYHLNR